MSPDSNDSSKEFVFAPGHLGSKNDAELSSAELHELLDRLTKSDVGEPPSDMVVAVAEATGHSSDYVRHLLDEIRAQGAVTHYENRVSHVEADVKHVRDRIGQLNYAVERLQTRPISLNHAVGQSDQYRPGQFSNSRYVHSDAKTWMSIVLGIVIVGFAINFGYSLMASALQNHLPNSGLDEARMGGIQIPHRMFMKLPSGAGCTVGLSNGRTRNCTDAERVVDVQQGDSGQVTNVLYSNEECAKSVAVEAARQLR